MLDKQNTTLINQREIINQATNLNWTIFSTSSNIKENILEFRRMTQEQKNSMNNIFKRLAVLQSMFLDEISSIYSVVFYTVLMLIWYLFTSTSRTAGARLPLFVITIINFITERIIIYYKTVDMTDVLTKANDETELYKLQWWCRKIYCIIGVCIIIRKSWCYTDIGTENNQLLRKMRSEMNQNFREMRSEFTEYFKSSSFNGNHLSMKNALVAEDVVNSPECNSSSTGYESDDQDSCTSYATEASDISYAPSMSQRSSSISSRSSSLASLQQELNDLKEEDEAYSSGTEHYNSPTNNCLSIMYSPVHDSSYPSQRSPMYERQNNRYNLRPRNRPVHSSVIDEAPQEFFTAMKHQ